jgi:hypothetical protein
MQMNRFIDGRVFDMQDVADVETAAPAHIFEVCVPAELDAWPRRAGAAARDERSDRRSRTQS